MYLLIVHVLGAKKRRWGKEEVSEISQPTSASLSPGMINSDCKEP